MKLTVKHDMNGLPLITQRTMIMSASGMIQILGFAIIMVVFAVLYDEKSPFGYSEFAKNGLNFLTWATFLMNIAIAFMRPIAIVPAKLNKMFVRYTTGIATAMVTAVLVCYGNYLYALMWFFCGVNWVGFQLPYDFNIPWFRRRIPKCPNCDSDKIFVDEEDKFTFVDGVWDLEVKDHLMMKRRLECSKCKHKFVGFYEMFYMRNESKTDRGEE